MSSALLHRSHAALADLSAALDAGRSPEMVRELAADVARRAWQVAFRAEAARMERQGVRPGTITTIRHGHWSISTDGERTWTVCPYCEMLLDLPDMGLAYDHIREHRRLGCAGDGTTSAINYAMERVDDTLTRER